MLAFNSVLNEIVVALIGHELLNHHQRALRIGRVGADYGRVVDAHLAFDFFIGFGKRKEVRI
ncbi:hypothetical protein D3C75_1113240 [compost metagenome]